MPIKGKTKKPQSANTSRSGRKANSTQKSITVKEPKVASTGSVTTFVKMGQYFGISRKDEVSSSPFQKSKECFQPDGIIVPLWFEILILALAVVVAYGHTLDVPFYLDDSASIVENQSLSIWHDFQNIWRFAPLRVLGYFSFALNREWNGFNVAGYHVVNIAIHFMAGLSLLALSKGILRTPALRDRETQAGLKWFPLITALLFLVHPLQTQAVTYIVQRLASLAGLFYLASLSCYIHGCLESVKRQRWFLFSGSLILGVCALFTKQNTVTLPLAILLIEIIFFRMSAKKALRLLIIVTVCIGAGWVFLSSILDQNPFSLESMEELTRETGDISRIEYFATQTKVLWIYIRYFFVPAGLHLDHDVEILTGILNLQPFLFLIGHLILLTFACFSVRRSQVVSFGIFFYYLSHLVESSIIPIRDVLFEHRTYLPNAGLCLALGWFFTSTLLSLTGRRIVVWAVVPVAVAFSVLTWQRNDLWRSPIELWKDNARKAPGNFRVWDALAQELLNAGRNQEAAQALNMGLVIKNQVVGFINWPSAISHITLLRRQGKLDEALSVADNYLQKSPNTRVHSKILASKGNIYIERRDYSRAEQSFRAALDIYSDNVPALTNLGVVLFKQGERENAREIFLKVLKRNPQQDIAVKYLELLASSRDTKP